MQTTGLKRMQCCLVLLKRISKHILRSLNLPTGRISRELGDISIMKQNQHTYHLFYVSA